MNDDNKNPARQEILNVLKEYGALGRKDIMAWCELIETEKQLTNYLYNMKKSGRVVQNDDRCYALPGHDVTPTIVEKTDTQQNEQPSPRRIKTQKRKKQSDSPARDHLKSVLELSAQHAQDALDEFVAFTIPKESREALQFLVEARDRARQAVIWVSSFEKFSSDK